MNDQPAASNQDILQAINSLQRRVDASTKKSLSSDSIPVFKSEGNREQYRHSEKLAGFIDAAIDSLQNVDDSVDILAAKESLLEASQLIKQRQKLIKLADRSALGWSTVKEYVTDDLAENSDDEKRLRKAEKAAAVKKADSVKKIRNQTKSRAPRSYAGSIPVQRSSFRRFTPYSIPSRFDNRVCFQCGISGHVRSNCPSLKSIRQFRQPAIPGVSSAGPSA